jgi:hypothetical protein
MLNVARNTSRNMVEYSCNMREEGGDLLIMLHATFSQHLLPGFETDG